MKPNLSDVEAAKVGLWLDDPYGDGIRLSCIREPSDARIATIEFVNSGQRTLVGLEDWYINRGRKFASTKTGANTIKRQQVL